MAGLAQESRPSGPLESAKLAGLDALLAGFVEQRVDLGLKILLFFFERANLDLDALPARSLFASTAS